MLATYFPLITLTLLGDAPVEAALPAQATFDPVALLALLPHWAQVGVAVVTALGGIGVPSSLVANYLDAYAKAKVARGERIPAWLEAVGSVLHGAGWNPRKAVKLAKSAVAKAKEPQS